MDKMDNLNIIDTTFKKQESISNITTVVLYIVLFLYRKKFTDFSMLAYSIILVGSINFVYVLNVLLKFSKNKENVTTYIKRRNFLIIRLLVNLVFIWIALEYEYGIFLELN